MSPRGRLAVAWSVALAAALALWRLLVAWVDGF